MTGADLDADAATDALPFFPREGQTIFRIFRIPPAGQLDRAALEAIAEGFFAEIGDPACRVDTSRHPLMHATPTIDYILLLSGEAELWLDEGDPVPLEAARRGRAARRQSHAWVNTGAEDAVFLAVMIGREAAMTSAHRSRIPPNRRPPIGASPNSTPSCANATSP